MSDQALATSALSDQQLKAMKKQIFSIDHVQIPICGDLQEAVAWYKKMFGLGGELPKPDAGGWFTGVGRGNLSLIKTDNADSKATFMKDGEELPVIVFKTFQIDSIYEQLISEGVKIATFTEPRENPNGFWRFLKFYDPWGNMIGFIQDPPDVPWYGTR